MALVEVAAATAIFNVLDAGQDYGDAQPAQIAQARAALQNLANAFAKCIPHLVSFGVVSTSDTVTVTGAVPTPLPGTAGAVAGSGTGTLGGLVQGSAGASTGLAGAIMAVLQAGLVPIPGADLAQAADQLALLADACAEFASYVMTNATVSTTVTGVATTLGVNGPSTGTGTGSVS